MTRTCTDCRATFQPKGSSQRLCWHCWRKQEDGKLRARSYEAGHFDGVQAGMDDSGADAGLLRNAVAFCHPDRHPAERELANRVTAQLLQALNGSSKAA